MERIRELSRLAGTRVSFKVSLLGLFLLTSAVIFAGGCSAKVGCAPWKDLPAEPEIQVADAEYFYMLATMEDRLTQNQAYRGILLWASGADASKNFGERVARLEELGLVGADWCHQPLGLLTRGRLANIVVRKLNMRSSLMLAVLGPTDRYARRELIYRNIMTPADTEYAEVTGAELVNVLKRADQYEQGTLPDFSQPPADY